MSVAQKGGGAMRIIVITIGVLGLIAMGCSKKEQPSSGGTDEGDRSRQ